MANMYIPFSTPEENDPDQFLNKAKELVRYIVGMRRPIVAGQSLDFEVYVVWFSKTLQNWKACLSTNISDGHYYEVTYDGSRGCAYVDTYGKISNDVVWDESRIQPNIPGKLRIPIPNSEITDVRKTELGMEITGKIPESIANQLMDAQGFSIDGDPEYPEDELPLTEN